MVEVLTIDTRSLGDRSYVATDGEVAIAIDPQRDIDRILELLEARALHLTHVFETLIHNDYVTGSHALAEATDATSVVSADDDVPSARLPVRDGDIIITGALRIRAVRTPGHTFSHLSYVVESEGAVPAVFSGGSLLYGSTGRPDLLGDEQAEVLARLQHASARRLVQKLPPEARLLPTHGFGSFCSSTRSAAVSATVSDEAGSNAALRLPVDAYVEQLLAGLSRDKRVFVLDVRRHDEHAVSHLAASEHIPHELGGRVGQLPSDRPIWVHCALGYRASIAASLLDRAGSDVVAVDDTPDATPTAGPETVGLSSTAAR